jgi:hypothetical protein
MPSSARAPERASSAIRPRDGKPLVVPVWFLVEDGTIVFNTGKSSAKGRAELLRTATAIAARYMGAARAEEIGKHNSGPGTLLVRLRPTKVLAAFNMTG